MIFAAAGHSQSAAIESAPVLHTNANLVLVDVVVTDHDKSVHGLDKSRFHIFEDGREQAIASFDEHQPAALASMPNLPKLGPHIYCNTPPYPGTGVVNVLLLDGLNTPMTNQMEVRRAMIDYLGKVQPGTQLAIFTLASRLRLAAGFTTNAAQLSKALQNSKNGAMPSVLLDLETPATVEDLAAEISTPVDSSKAQALMSDQVASLLQFTADIHAYQTDMRVRMTLDALDELARYLSAIPGRKNLVWFSGSFPMALDPDLTLRSPFEVMRNYTDQVRETSRLLAMARVAVYPVDARGVMPPPSFDVSSKGPRTGLGGSGFARANSKFFQQTEAEHTTMVEVAEQTGGRAYVSTNGLKEAMASAVEDGSNYYTIAYVPSAVKLDGQFHKLQVKLEGGYKAAYRRGYYAENEAKATAVSNPSVVAEAVQMGAPDATQILFQARVLPSTDAVYKNANISSVPAGAMAATLKGPVTRYMTELIVDARGLNFELGADGTHRAAIEFAVIAYDGEGKKINYIDRNVQLNLKPEQYAHALSNGLPVLAGLDLPAGKMALRIVVADQRAGRAGSLEVPVTVAGK
jgi:VWFA-related protein